MTAGTHYDLRMARERVDVAAELARAAAQDAACAAGVHDIAEVPLRHITWVAGERLEPGSKYCRKCHRILHRT